MQYEHKVTSRLSLSQNRCIRRASIIDYKIKQYCCGSYQYKTLAAVSNLQSSMPFRDHPWSSVCKDGPALHYLSATCHQYRPLDALWRHIGIAVSTSALARQQKMECARSTVQECSAEVLCRRTLQEDSAVLCYAVQCSAAPRETVT